jgi:hypothetical protein
LKDPELLYEALSMNINDLTSTPMADLVELDLGEIRNFLREPELPSDDALAVLDQALREKVVRSLSRPHDDEAWSSELDDFRRLIPHARKLALDQRDRRWATRWTTLGDLIASALEGHERRKRTDVSLPAHARIVLETVTRWPGVSQVELGRSLELKSANLSRILGILEARGLIQRRLVGRAKEVWAAGRSSPKPPEEISRGMTPAQMTKYGHEQAKRALQVA